MTSNFYDYSTNSLYYNPINFIFYVHIYIFTYMQKHSLTMIIGHYVTHTKSQVYVQFHNISLTHSINVQTTIDFY